MSLTLPNAGFPVLYIFVMGITGAGKSTFIQKATGDTEIKIGHGLGSETKEVQESVVVMENKEGKPCEVHLIDTPGFGDDFDSDSTVLEKIAGWSNNLSNRGQKISGVLYLHDISVPRMSGSRRRNLEMLPELIGQKNLKFLTMVTTHWTTLSDSDKAVKNEEKLMSDEKYWRKLLDGNSGATTRRFDDTDASALEIIREHLQHEFTTLVTKEMVRESRALADTSAGKIVDKNLALAYKQALKSAAGNRGKIIALEKRLELVKERLRHKFDNQRELDFQSEMERLESKQRVYRAVRWVVRLGTVAGVTTAIVLTGGLAAPAAGALPLVEGWAQIWSAHDRSKREEAKTNHVSSYDKELANYYKREELEDEEMSYFKSLAH